MRNRFLAAAASGLMAFGQVAPTVVMAQANMGSAAFPRSQLPTSGYTNLAGGLRQGQPLPAQPIRPQPLPAAYTDGCSQTVRVGLGGGDSERMLSLPRGKSAVVELPVDARDVLVSNPKVADVVLSTPRRIYVTGIGAGQTDAIFFDAAGRQLLSLNIRVDQDISALGQTLNRLLPGSDIRIEGLGDSLILSGEVRNAAEADKALRLAQGMVAKPEMVVNMLAVGGSVQVMLKVRVVEVSRTVIKQLGVNLNAIYNQIGNGQILANTASTFGVNGALLGGLMAGYSLDTTRGAANGITTTSTATTGLNSGYTLGQQVDAQGLPLFGTGSASVDIFGRPIAVDGTQATFQIPNNLSTTNSTTTVTNNGLTNSQQQINSGKAGSTGLNKAEAMLQAFERVGLVRTLAEPNLTAGSGESAKFLAGGEFPVPVAVDATGRITAEFKPYGVGLGFTPIVLSNGRISLKISTEVSELTSVGAFSLQGGSTTLSLPGLNVRRAETMVELPSGGGMMIAGLLQSKAKQTLDALPGVLQLPVLGALFRSRDFLNDETELVVIVTPYLVKPVRPDQLQTPADGLVLANDIQTTLLGRLNQGFGKPAPSAAAARTYQGPFGYVVD